MKSKAFAGLMTTLLLVSIMLYALPVKATPDYVIKIGIIGPVGLPHYSPAGMKEAAEMARDEVNTAGGVQLADGHNYTITLDFADENALPTPNPDAARSETLRLISDGCAFIIGGFRTEVTTAILETCAENKVPFFIDGASTTELLKDTVSADYNTYKYIFRIMPMCSTPGLFLSLTYWIQSLVPKLLPIFGYVHSGMSIPQIDYAVVTEDLAWTTSMHIALTDPTKYAGPAGYLSISGTCYFNCTYNARIPETATDLTPWLNQIKALNPQPAILVHEFSGRAGLPLIIQWKELGLKCLPIGINVLGQMQDHWSNTLGKCQYETILNPTGTASPVVPGVTDVFWNNFVTEWGKWPIYTAFGAYDAIKAMAEPTNVNPGSLAAGGWDTVNYLSDHSNQAALDAVITTIEATSRMGILGPFKYSTLNPYNPIGLWWPHDVYFDASSMSYTWNRVSTRGCIIQWQVIGGNDYMEVIDPINQNYSRKFQLLPTSYPAGYGSMADTDTVAAPGNSTGIDGTIDATDMSWVTGATWLSTPGSPYFNINGDLDANNYINIIDVAIVGRDYGKTVVYGGGKITLPP